MEDKTTDLPGKNTTLLKVEGGVLLAVDPCHLPADILGTLIIPDEDGWSKASLITAPVDKARFAVTYVPDE